MDSLSKLHNSCTSKAFHVLLVKNMQTKLNKIKCVVSNICKLILLMSLKALTTVLES